MDLPVPPSSHSPPHLPPAPQQDEPEEQTCPPDGSHLHIPAMETMNLDEEASSAAVCDGDMSSTPHQGTGADYDKGKIPPVTPPPPPPFNVSAPNDPPLSKNMSDDEFRSLFVMPQYLRKAMAAAVQSQQIGYVEAPPALEEARAPPHPLVVMINSRSGGRQGPALRAILNDLLSEEQVFDLKETPPKDFVRYGLGCLDRLAESGDICAKKTRNNIRIIVAGGDGTVGWVLGSLAELHVGQHTSISPVGIIPLGTGNDLARSFGWGGTFMFAWRSIVKKYLIKAGSSETRNLDSWQVVVKTTSPEIELPHALRPQQHIPLDPEENSSESSNDERAASFEGVFYNYFSIGMDAQVAYGFHHLREKAPHIAQGPVSNKLVYSSCSCVQGWFCTPCSANPRARGLRNVMRLYVKRGASNNWEHVEISPNVRAVVILNLQSYASGRNPWGQPDDEYNEKKGFVEPRSDDGLVEIFGLFDGWHASLVLLSLRHAKRIAQASALRFELVADTRHRVYMQVDGEPWRQPLSEKEHSTVIEIARVPTHSIMLKGS